MPIDPMPVTDAAAAFAEGWAPMPQPTVEVQRAEPITPEEAVLAELAGERQPSPAVAILGLGPSIGQYLDTVKRLGNRRRIADETWAINALGDILTCDLTFHMDDVRVQEMRAAAHPRRVARNVLELRQRLAEAKAADQAAQAEAYRSMKLIAGYSLAEGAPLLIEAEEGFRAAVAKAGEQAIRIKQLEHALAVAQAEAAQPESNIGAMLEWLKTHKGPVITSTVHPDYPCLVEYPLADVLSEVPFGYFNNTCAYAVAYAIFKGFKRISMWGCDFTYPNAHHAESGRGCVEFWLGYAAARGVRLTIASLSSLMDACVEPERRWYGYDFDWLVSEPGENRVHIRRVPRDKVPTADEIEARYDHAQHPAGAMAGEPGAAA